MAPLDLDSWLPDPSIRTHHQRHVPTDPATIWDAAASVRLDETRTLGRLVRWRIPGTPPDQTFHGLLATYPFATLAAGDTWSVSGLVGRIWTLSRDYPPLEGAEMYRGWNARGTVRVLMAHWVDPHADGTSTFHSEARVAPTDRWASMRLKSIWAVLGHFERLIGAEPLAVAERRARAAQPRPTSSPASSVSAAS